MIPRESTSAQLEEIGIISIIVETEYIPVNHIELKERHGPDFTEYKFQDHVYTTITALEQAVNTAIDNHQVLAGDEITIGYTTEVLGLSLYSYPEYDALLSVSREEAKIRILGEHELTIFFIYPRGSRGIIVPIHVEPIDPDVPPVSIPTEEFFGSYVNSITVTSNDGHDKTTVYSYDTLNSYLESLYTGTVVDISFDFQPGVIIKEASVGTISEGNTIKGVTLNGPEPVWKDTGEGRVLSGTWSGTLVDGDDGDDAHFEFGTVEWNQDYTEGTQTELSLTIASPPDPQVGLLSLRASTLDSEKTGIVAVAYVYTPQGVTLESGAKITISGSLNSTTNPDEKEQEALKTLPEAIYDVDEEKDYCGYWFSPDNGVDFKYFYSFTIKAVLTVGDVREEREITVEIEGSESSR